MDSEKWKHWINKKINRYNFYNFHVNYHKVPSSRKKNNHKLLRFYIFNGNRIYMDGFKSYRGLEEYIIIHKFVNHKKE